MAPPEAAASCREGRSPPTGVPGAGTMAPARRATPNQKKQRGAPPRRSDVEEAGEGQPPPRVAHGRLFTGKLVYLWDIYGIFMGYLWDIYGIFMRYLWDIYGIFMGYL